MVACEEVADLAGAGPTLPGEGELGTVIGTRTWVMGKGSDTHGPIGPWLVTADEVADLHPLRIQTRVDGIGAIDNPVVAQPTTPGDLTS